MYLGYQNGKIKFYTEKLLDTNLYKLDKTEFTEEEYVLDNNEYVLKDELWKEAQTKKESEKLAKLKLTKREVFLALYRDCGITPEQVKTGIIDNEALIEFEYANEYYRGNPLIDSIGASLGYSKEKLDYLFENKSFEGFISSEGGEDVA
jgi:hypothetical protein